MTPQLAEFLHFFAQKLDAPTSYGIFHIVSLIIMVALTVLLCVFGKNWSEKRYRKIMLIAAIIIIVLEIYKQVFFSSFKYDEGDPSKSIFEYDWYTFPFQFCATPMFVFPLLALLPRKGKVTNFIYDSLLGFTMTFILFGGLVTMIYPAQVFTRMIGINFQTMIHHGLMVVLGIYTFVYYRQKADYKFILKSLATFLSFIIVSLILNCTLGLYVKGIGETFNMFFISPFFPCTLPILDGIYEIAPYPIFLLIYIGGFTLVGTIIFSADYWIYKLVKKLRKN